MYVDLVGFVGQALLKITTSIFASFMNHITFTIVLTQEGVRKVRICLSFSTGTYYITDWPCS